MAESKEERRVIIEGRIQQHVSDGFRCLADGNLNMLAYNWSQWREMEHQLANQEGRKPRDPWKELIDTAGRRFIDGVFVEPGDVMLINVHPKEPDSKGDCLRLIRRLKDIAEVVRVYGLKGDKFHEEALRKIYKIAHQPGAEEALTEAVTQGWTHGLTYMMQTVLLTAIRGADSVNKNHVSKLICRWLRRCILISAFDRKVLKLPYDVGERKGGSFTGPSINWSQEWEKDMHALLGDYLQCVDDLPHHFQLHIMHAAEILGYYHPEKRIKIWWYDTYVRLAGDMHLHVETKEGLDFRLGDSKQQWEESETAPAKHPE